MNGPALKIHAGFTGHSALQLLVWQVVAPAVLDEHGAGLDKAEGHVGIHAFLPERLDPIKIAGAGTIIVFAAAEGLRSKMVLSLSFSVLFEVKFY